MNQAFDRAYVEFSSSSGVWAFGPIRQEGRIEVEGQPGYHTCRGSDSLR
jgi:hypothetical protein